MILRAMFWKCDGHMDHQSSFLSYLLQNFFVGDNDDTKKWLNVEESDIFNKIGTLWVMLRNTIAGIFHARFQLHVCYGFKGDVENVKLSVRTMHEAPQHKLT